MAPRPLTTKDESTPDPAYGEALAPPALQALFGERLRQARLAAGMTQAEMAERSGVHVHYVSKVELGQKNLTLGTMTKLAAVVGRRACRRSPCLRRGPCPR
jgi:DNA-binding XRE family transcriptional regulator